MRIRTLSPLAILKSPSGNFNLTLEYIPGTTIRGALAREFIQKKNLNSPPGNELFKRLFLSNEVIYDNAYIDKSIPIPLTARSCKIQSGFKTVSGIEQKDAHGVKDFLLEFLLYNKSKQKYDLNDYCIHKDCKAPMERIPGWCVCNPNINDFDGRLVNKREITRAAILSTTLTASDGQLYSIETLEDNQFFYGNILTKDNSLIDEIQNLLKKKKFHLGVGLTRGLGAVEITPGNFKDDSGNDTLPLENKNNQVGRFLAFNNKIQQLFSKEKINENKIFFSITLLSDLILKNGYHQYNSIIAIEQLKARLPSTAPKVGMLDNFRLILSFTRLSRVTGWSDVWKLPKHTDIAISKGSVFLYESHNELNEGEKNNLVKLLKSLENERIGERRNEGFGKIAICHSFHWRDIG